MNVNILSKLQVDFHFTILRYGNLMQLKQLRTSIFTQNPLDQVEVGFASTLLGAMVFLMSLTYFTNHSDQDGDSTDKIWQNQLVRTYADTLMKSSARPSPFSAPCPACICVASECEDLLHRSTWEPTRLKTPKRINRVCLQCLAVCNYLIPMTVGMDFTGSLDVFILWACSALLKR